MALGEQKQVLAVETAAQQGMQATYFKAFPAAAELGATQGTAALAVLLIVEERLLVALVLAVAVAVAAQAEALAAV
jgi:hypothetical protein